MKNSKLNLIEPIAVSDVFVTHHSGVHLIGDNVRLILAAEQVGTFDDKREHQIVARIVGSRTDMLQIAAAIVRGCNQSVEKATDAFLEYLAAPPDRH